MSENIFCSFVTIHLTNRINLWSWSVRGPGLGIPGQLGDVSLLQHCGFKGSKWDHCWVSFLSGRHEGNQKPGKAVNQEQFSSDVRVFLTEVRKEVAFPHLHWWDRRNRLSQALMVPPQCLHSLQRATQSSSCPERIKTRSWTPLEPKAIRSEQWSAGSEHREHERSAACSATTHWERESNQMHGLCFSASFLVMETHRQHCTWSPCISPRHGDCVVTC